MVRCVVLKIVTLVMLLSGFVHGAYAQDQGSNELGLLMGATVTPSQKIAGQTSNLDFGSGIAFQAAYARRLGKLSVGDVYFEVPFIASPLVSVSSPVLSVPSNYALLFVTPGLRFKFARTSAVSPWLSIGGGYALFEESKERQDGGAIPRVYGHRGTAEFGGGIDFRTPIKILFPIGFRAEAQDFYSGKPNLGVSTGGGFQHNLVFSGGFVLYF